MVSAVIIDDEVRKRIKQVKEHAALCKFTLENMMKVATGEAHPVGDDPDFCVHIPQYIKVVFSYDEQPPPIGMCKHLSVSVALEGRIPNPVAIQMIMQEFGFKNSLERCITWKEEHGPNTATAINIIEPENGVWPKEVEETLNELLNK